MSHKQLSSALSEQNIDIAELGTPQSRFPILFVYGRSDLTVPFYGAKVYPTDVEEIINAEPSLINRINSFQIASYEDTNINRRLKIRLELVRDIKERFEADVQLRDLFYDGLCQMNQDFREVTKMFDRSCVEIEIYDFETGPFSERDIRVKNRYVSQG
jgi:phenylacetate-CoA ligase